MDGIKKHRTPVGECRGESFILNTISMAQKGRHIEVLNAGEKGMGSQDISIKASNGGSKDIKKTGQEERE